MADLFDKCKNFTQAKEIMSAGIYPYFHQLESKQDTEVMMEGHKVYMLGSNNYLGLTSHPDVKKASIEAIEKYGTGCSGSRFLNGNLDLHNQLEEKIAKFVGKEACMTFGTGFQTNLGIISAIAGHGDYIIGDKENHASIYDGCKLSYAKLLRYNHSDMQDLERVLKNIPLDSCKLIVTDGVFSMSGEICKLPEIVELAEKYNARIMVDDAHGFGVIGEGGRGTASYFNLTDKVDILMCTFSKSLASLGGYCAASDEVIHYLRHTSRPYIFSASIPPSNVAAASKALDILMAEPERPKRLMQLADYMRAGLKARGVSIRDSQAPIIPINTYTDYDTFAICKKLFENGVYVNPVISPAVAPGDCIIRSSLMATFNEEQLDKAMDIIRDTINDYWAEKNKNENK